MPKKNRELKELLRKAGFIGKKGRGSHTKWRHPQGKNLVVLSGKDGADAKPYQEREVQAALAEIKQ